MMMVMVALIHLSRPSMFPDVICDVSGVAQPQVPKASLNTAPFGSLSLTDHSTFNRLKSMPLLLCFCLEHKNSWVHKQRVHIT